MGHELTPPRIEGRIRLPDGRQLGFAEYGVPTGDPILWFHGTPGARRQIPQLAREAAFERNIRLVALERPGIGDSPGHSYRSVRDWSTDVGYVVDHIGIGRFGLIALSGGGPYALACAHDMPDRVIAACILGGVCPSRGDDAPAGGFINFFRPVAPVIDLLYRQVGVGASLLVWGLRVRPLADWAFDLYIGISPEGDKRVFRRPEMREMFMDDLLRASRKGVRSLAYDARLFLRHWGFSVRDIRVPVRWWHGDADNFVPLSHAEHVVPLIPDAELSIRPGESHLGSLDAVTDVIETILALWPDHVEPLHAVE
jgi:pimeloyl-ACP methyl ester carboxylesterase